MIKSELIDKLAARFHQIEHEAVADSVNLMLERMSRELVNRGRIEIRGFGSWFVKYRAERNAHNPRTGVKVRTSAKYTPRFKAGKELRERVNASRHLPINLGKDDSDSDL